MASSRPRLLSLDVFRGLTVAGAILVNSPGNGTAYAPLEHSEWNGCTPTDLVFPFFIFILGVSLVFSFSRRRETGHGARELAVQLIRRTAILFGLGLLLNGFPYTHLEAIRIPGVLQRIALCYFAAGLLSLEFGSRSLVVIVAAILVGYFLALTRIPVPGFGAGVLTPQGNLAAFIDRRVFRTMYFPDFDPEGILSTFPAITTALLGVLTGRVVYRAEREEGASRGRAARLLIILGLAGIGLGGVWNIWFPINKSLWTSSYVLVTGGAASLLLGLLYWGIDLRGAHRRTFFFQVFGMNAVFAYVVPLFLLKTMNHIPVDNPDGTAGNLRLFVTRTVFGFWRSPQNASLSFAVAHVLFWFGVCYVLYRKRIFIKV